MKKILTILLAMMALVSVTILSSCATVNLNASTVEKPVKMNMAGEKSYTVVKEFTIKDKAGWVLGIVPVNKPGGDNQDYLAQLLRDQITTAGGDAVVDVQIKAQNGFDDILINIVSLGVYATRTVTITGKVIKYN